VVISSDTYANITAYSTPSEENNSKGGNH
jgi:hypothetical protein